MKNINPIERRIEWLILGIGVIFALCLIYKNFAHDPNQVPSLVQPGAMVTPANVGAVIVAQAQSLQESIRNQESHPVKIGNLPDYVNQMVAEQTNPLSQALVALSAKGIGPYNMPVGSTSGPQVNGLVYMAPTVPALTMPQAEQSQAVVYVPPPVGNTNGMANANINPANGNAANLPPTKGMFWVTLNTDFPMAKWMASIAAKDKTLTANQSPLPEPYHITSFYRVQVRRQQLMPDGRWSAWKKIKGLYLDPLPTLDLAGMNYSQRTTLLQQLNGIVSEILDPAFYATQEVQRRIASPGQKTQRPHPMMPPNMPNMPPGFGPGGPSAPGGFMPPNITPTPQPQIQQQPQTPAQSPYEVQAQQSQQVQLPPLTLPQPGRSSQPNYNVPPGGFNNGGTSVTTGPASMTDMTSVPIRFYDVDVTPGDTYRYEIRVIMYNPAFNFPNRLNKAAIRDTQWLNSPWSKPSEALRVNSDLYFFVTGTQPAEGTVSFALFKWKNGQWLDGTQNVHLGESIGDEESVSVITGNGTLAPVIVDFGTGYHLVDEVPIGASGSVNVVLYGPEGKLHLRNSTWDMTSPQEQKLFDLSNEVGTPTAPTTPNVTPQKNATRSVPVEPPQNPRTRRRRR